MWPLKSILFFVLFWSGCLLALANPIWGVATYMLVYQTHPAKAWWGKPVAALGIRFSLLAAAFTLVGLFLGKKRIPQVKGSFLYWELGVIGLVGLAVLLSFLDPVSWIPSSSYHSRLAFEKLWKMLLFVLVLTRLASNRTHFRLVIWALVLGSLYVGYDAYRAPASTFYHGRLNHIGGPDFSTTSGLAAYLSAMLPIAGVAFLITDKWKWKLLAAVSAAFSVNGIVMCRTRSAFIGLFAGALVALLAAPRARRYRIHVLLIAGAVAGYSLTDSHFWDRMGTLTDPSGLQEDQATLSRTDIWKASARIVSDFPQGIGAGNFGRVIGVYEPLHKNRSSHNTAVVCFVELGLFGGFMFLAIAYFSANPLETKLIAYGLLVSVVTYLVTGAGTERFYCESFWWVIALPVPLYRIVVREADSPVDVWEPDLGPLLRRNARWWPWFGV
jgi:hypothetical protein